MGKSQREGIHRYSGSSASPFWMMTKTLNVNSKLRRPGRGRSLPHPACQDLTGSKEVGCTQKESRWSSLRNRGLSQISCYLDLSIPTTRMFGDSPIVRDLVPKVREGVRGPEDSSP